MTVPFRTLALFGSAAALVAAGYMFAPAPGAARLPGVGTAQAAPAQPVATPVQAAAPAPVVQAAAHPKPATDLVATRAPVPVVTQTRTTFFQAPTTADGKPANGNSVSAITADGMKAGGTDGSMQALTAPTAPADDSRAKQAVEQDGYKNVRGLVKAADGTWRGKAMRGRTEVAIVVDATGNVSAE